MVYLPWPGLRHAVARYSLLSLGATGAYLALLVPIFLLASPVAALLTEIAANPPVNAADMDAIRALYGLPVGLVFGLVLAGEPGTPRILVSGEPSRGSAPRVQPQLGQPDRSGV